MIKRIAVVALLALALCPIADARRQNTQVTVTAGTPIRLSTTKRLVNRIFIQMAIGGTGVGYVFDGIANGTTPDPTHAADLTAQLCAATATAPGCNYSDVVNSVTAADAIDLSQFWVSGSHTGDVLIISFAERI